MIEALVICCVERWPEATDLCLEIFDIVGCAKILPDRLN